MKKILIIGLLFFSYALSAQLKSLGNGFTHYGGRIIYFQSNFVASPIIDDPLLWVSSLYGNYTAGSVDSLIDNSENGYNFNQSNSLNRAVYVDVEPPYFDFDGVNDYYYATDNTILDFNTNDFSISGKIKTSTDVTAFQFIYSKLASAEGYGVLVSSGYFRFALSGSGGGLQFTNTFPISTEEEYVFTVNFDRDDKVYVYLNGTLYGDFAYSTGNEGSVSNTTVANIGRRGSGTQRYSGDLFDLKIYDRLLTTSEIQDYYNELSPSVSYNDVLDNSEVLPNFTKVIL